LSGRYPADHEARTRWHGATTGRHALILPRNRPAPLRFCRPSCSSTPTPRGLQAKARSADAGAGLRPSRRTSRAGRVELLDAVRAAAARRFDADELVLPLPGPIRRPLSRRHDALRGARALAAPGPRVLATGGVHPKIQDTRLIEEWAPGDRGGCDPARRHGARGLPGDGPSPFNVALASCASGFAESSRTRSRAAGFDPARFLAEGHRFGAMEDE